MIELILNIIALIVACFIAIYFILFVFKRIIKTKDQKKAIKEIEIKVNKVRSLVYHFVLGSAQLILCIVLAMGTIPLIYKLNEPLGMGYAKFASYAIAILLWMMIGGRFTK